MNQLFAIIGLVTMVLGIIDSVRHDARREFGWALFFKLQAALGAGLFAGMAS